MPKLVFYIDFNRDIEIYKKHKIRKFFGEKVFNKFLKQYYPELVGKNDKEILDYFKKNKRKIIEEAEKAGKKLEQNWKKVGKDFFKEIERVTGFKWRYKTYKCHLSSTFICGGCYDIKKGNVVSVFPKIKHASPLYVLFHELTHLHFWDTISELKIKCNKEEEKNRKGKIWCFSEVAVNYPLKKIKIKNFNPIFNIYPQHKELWKRVEKYWNLDFKNFILNIFI